MALRPLRHACADDPGLAAEVGRLLESHARGEGMMDRPALDGERDWMEPAESPLVGRRFGAYRIEREIGRGGMGAVYLAERADGAYAQRAAIKLVKRGMDTDLVLGRFHAERQILASLEHPNIARLLDGGTMPDGGPYFVMEYIAGLPLDAYAVTHRLSIDERLELFLQICAAVSYAHQHLVVHRDLKPINILVTAEGAPKLLDFGIAKVLSPEHEEATSPATGFRLLTPKYASPEQIEGRPATTASDVYSLGVVLYELLTGRSPYRLRAHTPFEVAAAVRTTEPERPSSAATAGDAGRADRRIEGADDWVMVTRSASVKRLRRRLRGDLDTILLTALRKDPARRYPSVEQLAADLRRHLAGRPVRAQPDSFGYRAGKFLRRNRLAVAAGGLLVAALIGGIVSTAWQARQAQAAQARAERRFEDVRRLAHAVIFDYHDAIKDLPGSIAVRERLVRDGLGSLDTLAREGPGDVALQRELARAYQRIGDLQGGVAASNLGDPKGALESYRKGIAILNGLVASDSSDLGLRRDLASLSIRQSQLVFDAGDLATSLTLARRARDLLQPLAPRTAFDADAALELGAADDLAGTLLLETGDPRASADLHRHDLDRLMWAPAADRASPDVRRAISVAHHHLAAALVQLGDLPGALEHYRRALSLRTRLAAEFPQNTDYRGLVGAANYSRSARGAWRTCCSSSGAHAGPWRCIANR